MGVDLVGRGRQTLSVNWSGWRFLLDLSRRFGWKPQGTGAPPDFGGNWPGTYFSNDGQIITDAEAVEIAAALRRGLPSAEAAYEDASGQELPEVVQQAIALLAQCKRQRARGPHDLVAEAIEFFSKGGCRIY